MTPPSLPAEVADTRRRLEALLRRVEPAHTTGHPHGDGGEPGVPHRPTVSVVAAPGRGRHDLVAALLGLDALPAGTRRVSAGAPGGTGDVVTAEIPLLEELDLALPAHRADGTWSTTGATALLVLADAGAPLDRAELAALTTAAARVEAVVFALVRTEAHRGWRTVLEADRALVAEHLPRLRRADWFAVSTALARRAGATDDPATAAALRRASGVAPLQQALHRLVARRHRMFAEANALRTLATALQTVAERAEAARDALPSAGDPGLGHRRADLDAARADLRRGRHVRWRSGLAQARIAATDDLTTRVRALGAVVRDEVDSADRAGLAAVPPRVAGGVEGVAAAVVAALGERLRDLVAETLADLLPAAELAALRVPAPRSTPPPAAPGAGGAAAERRLLVLTGASGGLGLSRLALLPLLAVPVAPAVLGPALVPVSVGLGLGATGWLVHTRRLAADRARMRQWVADALAAARTDLERALAEALVTAEREVTLALDDALDRRARELAAAAGAADDDARRTAADRTAARHAAATTVAQAREGVARAEALLARMAELVGRPTDPGPD